MAKESSFDIVSTVDMQEVDNAFQQAKKELSQRYDRSRSHSINWPGSTSSSPAWAARIFSAMVMGRVKGCSFARGKHYSQTRLL